MTPQTASTTFLRIAEYYDDLVGQYGHDPKACDYGQPETQRYKFDVLTRVTNLHGLSVLDVGCGFADLADYVKAHGWSVDYTGIDLSLRMVEEAARLHPDLNICHGNILDSDWPEKSFDVVAAICLFYLLGAEAKALAPRLIERMFALSRNAVAFSTLSSWATDPKQDEYYADPSETLRFCGSLTPWVTLVHDYHPRDFTVFLYRAKQLPSQ